VVQLVEALRYKPLGEGFPTFRKTVPTFSKV